MTIGILRRHGDFGIGTFNALDGEMIVIDGTIYRLAGDGTAKIAADSAKTPYAAVTWFEPDIDETVNRTQDKRRFEGHLDELAASPNLFYAVRFDGKVPMIRIRNVVRQTPPYRPLMEAIADQVVHELDNVEGTLIGFRCPDYAVGIGVPGYHLHFITAERGMGGHVLDYELAAGRMQLDHTSSLHLELPQNREFNQADLAAGAAADAIHKVEN